MFGAIIAIGAVVIAGIVALFVTSRKSVAQKQIGARSTAGLLTDGQVATVRKANQDILHARQLAGKVTDAQLQQDVRGALSKAEGIVKTMKEQPEEIRRANQFFSYYLPTMGVVLEKYLTLQDSGTATEETLAKVKEYVANMTAAFEKQHDNLFKDEELDLTVEVEAMQLALKRDGLMS